MKLLISISILFYCLLLSCSDNIFIPENHLFSLSDTLSLDFRETLANSDENISISFNSIISDGRCPVDLRCFWEGNAEIRLIFRKGTQNVEFSLNTAGSYFPNDTLLFGYSIKLIDLLPYPISNLEYKPHDYSVKLVIE